MGVLYPAFIVTNCTSNLPVTSSYSLSHATLPWMFPAVTSTPNTKPCLSQAVCFVSKLPLVLSFYEHSAVGVCGGNRLFCRFSSAASGMIFVVLVFNGLLAQLFSFLVDLSAQLFGKWPPVPRRPGPCLFRLFPHCRDVTRQLEFVQSDVSRAELRFIDVIDLLSFVKSKNQKF